MKMCLIVTGFRRVRRNCMNNRQQRKLESLKTHRLSIQNSLQRRLEVARAKGDETLVHLLQIEAEYYN